MLKKQYSKKLGITFFLLSVTIFISSCYYSTPNSKLTYIYDQFGLSFSKYDQFYLAHNIWYKNPMDISYMNYQQGKIIPFGTEIKFIESYPDYVVFETVKDKKQFKIINEPEYSMLTDEEFFKQVFTHLNPMNKLEDVSQKLVSKLEKGEIEVGMTREDVLISLGPPPLCMTPPGTKITWIYFLNDELKTNHIVFQGNKVSYIFQN